MHFTHIKITYLLGKIGTVVLNFAPRVLVAWPGMARKQTHPKVLGSTDLCMQLNRGIRLTDMEVEGQTRPSVQGSDTKMTILPIT
jgi:hypothetical protein